MKKIYKTKNYEKFKFMVGNRPINSAHTAKLIESIKGKYLFNPIIINEKWEIIDGQHRFEAIKQLNLPLYFFINEGYSYDE
ncbi:MAG: ParB N-terminal domain-containing protein, partial [Bacteroidetes bacterium]|nr:ParB N-terminal domain-containing protein [Bacteroidota bacterium]